MRVTLTKAQAIELAGSRKVNQLIRDGGTITLKPSLCQLYRRKRAGIMRFYLKDAYQGDGNSLKLLAAALN